MTTLHRDPSLSRDFPHVDELPAWLRPYHGEGYWHRVRSAIRRPNGELIVRLYCGQHRFVNGPVREWFSEAEPEDMACGTCFGRAHGHKRTSGLVFRPVDHWSPPKKCPGRGVRDWPHLCFACGVRTRTYGWQGREVVHRPDIDVLLERFQPCPAHGWRNMRADSETLVCGYWQCDFDGTRSKQRRRRWRR